MQACQEAPSVPGRRTFTAGDWDPIKRIPVSRPLTTKAEREL